MWKNDWGFGPLTTWNLGAKDKFYCWALRMTGVETPKPPGNFHPADDIPP